MLYITGNDSRAPVAESSVRLPPATREIALSQTHPRYYARDFERRWQTRLNTPPRRTTNNSSQLHVEVTHRFPAPSRYSWALRPVTGLAVEESRVQFTSWEDASQAGK